MPCGPDLGALTVMDGRNQQLAEALAEQESLLESAAASERLLENVIDSVDVGIVVVDRDGHDVLMNRAQRRIHQLASPPGNDDPNESQLLLWHPGSALPMPPEQRPVRRAVLQETFTNSLVAMGQTQREARVLSASARQVIDHRGERSGAVVVFSDVTSYIDMVRSQEQFVAAVSHELRTPLTSVIGYLELAQDDGDLSRETASYLQVAQRNADQLLLIVQDLLADQVARSGTEQLTLRPARLSEIAQQAAESVALRAEKRGITLERRIVETPELPLDAQRLQQAVGNLLSNALKYTPRGGRVCVHTAVEDHHLELAVTDTGIGMSDQEQTNLFTDYYRTETARNSDIPGHGIGLSLTRRIVVAHGGQISVSSRPGEGSTFTIRFGLDEVEWADRARTGGGRPGSHTSARPVDHPQHIVRLEGLRAAVSTCSRSEDPTGDQGVHGAMRGHCRDSQLLSDELRGDDRLLPEDREDPAGRGIGAQARGLLREQRVEGTDLVLDALHPLACLGGDLDEESHPRVQCLRRL
ncbi:sensor histidine kinase [Brachybacterium muris]|uniref:sensor histidine kinase n=1 Tax=Brachybacterium muris TaxID=219301 RepID=UPI003B967D54